MIPFQAGSLRLQVNDSGFVQSIRIGDGPELTPPDKASPILSLRIGKELKTPTSAFWYHNNHLLKLTIGDHLATVRIDERSSHLALELVAVEPSADVELAVWGPFSTSLKEMIGETIGVVQGKGQAFGLQVLNAKTLGGFPNTEDDIEPSYSIFDSKNITDIADKDFLTDDYRGDTAKPTDFGSVVQAYVRNRSETRIIENWGHHFYTAPAFKDGGVVGSKIALFGCESSEALYTIGKIEVYEGLPHPMIDGVWGKTSPTAHESYLVMNFDTKNLDECLDIANEAGIKYLYSDSCFDTWGHFRLNPIGFPKNWESMKECVERAKAKGVRLGVHTLSNFITTNDPYVTPIPDRRLAEVGASFVDGSLNSMQTDVVIEDPKFFNQMSNNTLRTVRVDEELIQYTSVSAEKPWTLLKCKRGAFGTKASDHRAWSRIAKLMDHGYQTFLTNADLTKEVAHNVADLFNQTGLQQLSMDGLEGNWSTGMGQYGRALFAKTWYDNLSPELKGQVINDASNPGAYNWHINTRENWGEPWYAGFRKSQTLYRLKNQRYFRRNLMPGMLGWFQLTPQTTPEDIEWLLARAAGFDAGFCITANLTSVKNNRQMHEILGTVKAWESARHAHAFTEDLIPRLQNINEEFELKQKSPKSWLITPVESKKFTVGTRGNDVQFTVHTYSKDAQLIVQIPAGLTWTHQILILDGGQNVYENGNHPSDLPSKYTGYERHAIQFVGLVKGEHTLKIGGELSAEKFSPLDCELRIPKSEPIELRPKQTQR